VIIVQVGSEVSLEGMRVRLESLTYKAEAGKPELQN